MNRRLGIVALGVLLWAPDAGAQPLIRYDRPLVLPPFPGSNLGQAGTWRYAEPVRRNSDTTRERRGASHVRRGEVRRGDEVVARAGHRMAGAHEQGRRPRGAGARAPDGRRRPGVPMSDLIGLALYVVVQLAIDGWQERPYCRPDQAPGITCKAAPGSLQVPARPEPERDPRREADALQQGV